MSLSHYLEICLFIYCGLLENVNLGCVKASRLRDRKASCISLIQRALRSRSPESFHASRNLHFQANRSITFSAFFNAASWPTYSSMSYEAALKTAKKTFKNSIFKIVR